MQSPRHPSHRTSITLSRPYVEPTLEQDQEKRRGEQDGEVPGASTGEVHQEDRTICNPERDDHDRYDGKKRRSRMRTTVDWARRHLKFLGPGLIASAAYIDPGNYATDLQAGATYGYALLAVVLMSGLVGILMQILAARLGIVTGRDVAEHCRLSLHDRPKNPRLWRWGVLYPLYIIAESGIIFTDLAELLGTATAFHLLIPAIPLYGGVLLTSLDVLIILIAFNSYPSEQRNRSIIAFEVLISLLVLTVLAAFIILVVRLSPDWGDVFHGYIPSHTIVSGGALYISVGIVGATVMPHSLFLGSKLATISRTEETVKTRPKDAEKQKMDDSAGVTQNSDIELSAASPLSRSRSVGPSLHMPQPIPFPSMPFPERSTKPRSLAYIRTHLHHAQLDIATSLFFFALVINSAILIVAAAAFYYGSSGTDVSGVQEGNLFTAYDLLKARVGQAFAYLFALALMMSGQAASITATLAGQVVSEGFIEWRTTPWKRRLVTRMISMIPSIAVAAAVGESGINTLLVASQVTLSLVLPFVMFPVLYYTSSRTLMSIPSPESSSSANHPQQTPFIRWATLLYPFGSAQSRSPEEITFANNMFIVLVGWAIFAVVVIADVYALVSLGQGKA